MAQWINLFRNNGFLLQTPTTLLVRKIGPIRVAEPGLMAGGRQADEMQVNFEISKNHCTSKDLTFCFV